MEDQEGTKEPSRDATGDLHAPAGSDKLMESEDNQWRKLCAGLMNGLSTLGVDPLENIGHLTTLCGELLHGACALYNRLEEGMLCSMGQWNVPPGFDSLGRAEGHICYDVIRKGVDEPLVVRNLPQSPYASTDPNVMKYSLQTYIGHPVKFGECFIGALCVVFSTDVAPTEKDILVIRTIASAIAREEQRWRAESALSGQVRFLQTLIEAISNPICYKDEKGIYLGCNQAYADWIGLEKDQVLGRSVHDLVPQEFAERYRQQDEETFAGPGGKVFESTSQRPDGSLSWTIVSKSTFLNVDGSVGGLIAVISDVSRLKRVEEALKLERQQLLSIFDSINEVISVVDAQTYRFLYINKFMQSFYGKELMGKVCFKELHGFDEPCPHCVMATAKELAGEPFQWEYHNPTSHRVYLATDRIIRWSDGRDAKFHLGIDITDRRRAEEERESLRAQLFQAQKMEALGTLTGGIAHDFNNLLHIMQGYAELLLEGRDEADPDFRDIEEIFRSAGQAADLVQKLLIFSQKAEPNPQPMDLNQRIEHAMKIMVRTLPKMTHVHALLAPDLARVHADPAQIDQVLVNLAINAQEAMPEGGRLTFQTRNVVLDDDFCRLHPEAHPGRHVAISVSDSGRGIDRTAQQRIFDPFFTTKERGERRGTGLGLAVVLGIVRGHGGFIECASEVGRGTTFTIYLLALADESPSARSVPGDEAQRGGETILLVDDEDLVLQLGTRVLQASGYAVLVARNGREALELYTRHGPDIKLIILDLIMPEMGGYECLEKLLFVDPRVKVLVATGYHGEVSMNDAMKRGARAFVGKPFRMQDLLTKVRDILDED